MSEPGPSMNEPPTHLAEYYLSIEQPTLAFVEYLRIACDTTANTFLRASCWHAMGIISGRWPEFAIGTSDTGYWYYMQAIKLSPSYLEPHYMIVQTYATSGGGSHHDTDAYTKSMGVLMLYRDEWPDGFESTIAQVLARFPI
jgi:hypothetical protein